MVNIRDKCYFILDHLIMLDIDILHYDLIVTFNNKKT